MELGRATRTDPEDGETTPSDEVSRLSRPSLATVEPVHTEGPRPNGGTRAEGATRVLVGRTVAAVERDLILCTLDHCGGNRTHAARLLGISIRTLRNKLSDYLVAGLAVAEPGGTRSAA